MPKGFHPFLLIPYFLFANNNEIAQSGNGIHQKSFSSDKWLLLFPITYIAAEAARHNMPRILKSDFLFIAKVFINVNIEFGLCNRLN